MKTIEQIEQQITELQKQVDKDELGDVIKNRLLYDGESGVITWKGKAKTGLNRDGKVAGHKNNALGYVLINVSGNVVSAHRIAWLLHHGSWPDKNIDHINGNGFDNRICNLRSVSQSVNVQNKRNAQSNNKSGYLGVSKNGSKWRATIRLNGKSMHIGYFNTPEEAHAAYLIEKRKLHEGCSI